MDSDSKKAKRVSSRRGPTGPAAASPAPQPPQHEPAAAALTDQAQAAAGLGRDRSAALARRRKLATALQQRGIPRRSPAVQLRREAATSAAIAAAAAVAPPQPTKSGGSSTPASAPQAADAVPHAPTLPYLANTNDDDSSDPEDVADTSLFNAVYTDLLATEQARQSAETFTVGLSDSDDESDGDSVDMLSGQTVLTEEEMLGRRLAALKKLRELYAKQHSRLRRVLANRRLAYARERDAITSQLHKIKARNPDEENPDWDEPNVPQERLQLMQMPPLIMDINFSDVNAKQRYKRPTGAAASLIIRRERQLELAGALAKGDHTAALRFTCAFEEGDAAGQQRRCRRRNLPLSRFCVQHILHDPQQWLYKACSHGRGTADACKNPIVKCEDPPVCDEHLELKSFASNPRLCVRVAPAMGTATNLTAHLTLLGGGLDEDFQALLASTSGPDNNNNAQLAAEINLGLEDIKSQLQEETSKPADQAQQPESSAAAGDSGVQDKPVDTATEASLSVASAAAPPPEAAGAQPPSLVDQPSAQASTAMVETMTGENASATEPTVSSTQEQANPTDTGDKQA